MVDKTLRYGNTRRVNGLLNGYIFTQQITISQTNMKKALLFAGALLASFSLSAQDASASADSLFNMLDEITVTSDVIDIAKVRETPVAVSTISPSDISLKVGNMEFRDYEQHSRCLRNQARWWLR